MVTHGWSPHLDAAHVGALRYLAFLDMGSMGIILKRVVWRRRF